jgi:NADH-quinone oxidoreductase subunit J
MSGLEFIFLIIAAITLSAAFQTVTKANLVHAALWLIVALFGVAASFVLLNAGFLAVVQVVVYIGAIAILMIFAIMLTRNMLGDNGSALNKNAGLAALLSVVLFIGLSIILFNSGASNVALPNLAARADPIQELGIALVNPNAFIIPFELASVLLLAALIGAIVVAGKNK